MDFSVPVSIALIQTIGSFGLLGAFYYVASAIYCIYFHPLASYPGPWLAKFSVWPSYYHSARGNRHIWIWQCHQLYGPCFRDSPNGVIFNTPTAQRAIYDAKANVKKGKYYKMWPLSSEALNTWSSTDKLKHARKRRILNAAFSDKALRSSEPYLIKHADRWCKLLVEPVETDWSHPRNMADWADYLVFDILGDLCYARSFGIKEPGPNELRFIPKLICDYVQIYHPLACSPIRPIWLWLKPRGLDRAMEVMRPENLKTYLSFVESCIIQRTKEEQHVQSGLIDKGDVRKDFFHHIFQAKDPETGNLGYSKAELFSESDLLIVAGSDTTSTVFAAMFFYMTKHPAVYEKLTTEIRTKFVNAKDIHAGPDLTSCRYLRAFIDETMRMNPPVGGDMNREVLKGGLAFDGHVFKEGTNIGVSLYSLHSNESSILDPFAFRPERWILDEKNGVTAESIAAVESVFYPFSSGPRACPGKQLAYLEMTITMAKVLFLADVEAVEGSDLGAGRADLMWGRRNKLQYQLHDYFVATRDGPMVQFKARAV